MYSAWEFVREIANFSIFHINDKPVTVGVLVLTFLIIIGAVIFSKYLRNLIVKHKIVVLHISQSTEYIALRFIHYGIILAGFIIALSFIGLDFTNLAIIAGALGVGIGFGLQSMVSNIIAGFTLLLNKFLKVGDIIELEQDLLGRVMAINLQETLIETLDGANIIIPNSELTSKRLTNWTMYNTCRRYKVPFGVAYGTDKDRLRKAIIAAIKKLPYVVSEEQRYPSPEILLNEFGQNTIDFLLIAWVDLGIPFPHGTAHSSLMWVIDNILQEEGVEIPFPRSDVYIKEMPG